VFAGPARKLVALARLDPRSRPATAFALSGFLHACASYTQPGPTRPLCGPFSSCRLLALRWRRCWRASWALGRACEGGCRWVGRLVRLVCVHVWFYYGAVAGGRFCEGTNCGCTSRSLSVRCVRWGSASGAMGAGAGVGSGCICIGGRGGGIVAWRFEHVVLEFKRDR
jgi:hypothetical protein